MSDFVGWLILFWICLAIFGPMALAIWAGSRNAKAVRDFRANQAAQRHYSDR